MTESDNRSLRSELSVLRRIDVPDEIGNMIALLSTLESGFMTGSEIIIDGGYTSVK